MKLKIRCREIQYEVGPGEYEIGRAGLIVYLSSTDGFMKPLIVGSQAVSRFRKFKGHLTVEVQENKVLLYDNHSTNGSEFNGCRFERLVLEQFGRDYEVLIGDVNLHFELLKE